MSKEGSPELIKSWVLIDSENIENQENSCVEEILENEQQGDSDTDSISVISESGCSYKTDEDECITTELFPEKQIINEIENSEIIEEPKPIEKITVTELSSNNKKIEKLLYFATSAVCAIILIAFSIAVQHYFQDTSELETHSDQQFVYSHIQTKPENLRNDNPKKRRNQYNLNKIHNKLTKIQNNDIHDKILEDNDPKVERNFKSNYKLNKNKNTPTTCNKEYCDVIEKNEKILNNQNNDNNQPNNIYNKKIKELKIKEDYLKEKEKFLIEKEHDLLKQEIKLNKKKHDKKNKQHNINEFNENITYRDRKHGYKIKNKKYSTKHKFFNEHEKKRNISGHWYLNLHEARDNMRQRKRASFKRNKAHWYFQWMVDRARLRVK